MNTTSVVSSFDSLFCHFPHLRKQKFPHKSESSTTTFTPRMYTRKHMMPSFVKSFLISHLFLVKKKGWLGLQILPPSKKKNTKRLVLVQTITSTLRIVCFGGNWYSEIRSRMRVAAKNQCHCRRTPRKPCTSSLQ